MADVGKFEDEHTTRKETQLDVRRDKEKRSEQCMQRFRRNLWLLFSAGTQGRVPRTVEVYIYKT